MKILQIIQRRSQNCQWMMQSQARLVTSLLPAVTTTMMMISMSHREKLLILNFKNSLKELEICGLDGELELYMLIDSDAAGKPLGKMILPRLPSIILAMIYSCFRYIILVALMVVLSAYLTISSILCL